jgi:thioredoxin 1
MAIKIKIRMIASDIAHPEITVKSINIDDEEELAEKYGVSSIPCFVVLKDGEEVAREVGAMPLKKLEKLVGVKHE